jgi:hypothetical protein
MKHVLIAIFSGALLLGITTAQNGPAPSAAQSPEQQTSGPTQSPAQAPQAGTNRTPAGAASRFAPGIVIPVELAKTIDAKKAKTGDEVIAKVTQDLKNNSGEVVVPKDTKVLGRVTETQARSKEQKESDVGIAFDRAVMKNGNEIQMPMSIQAIIGPQPQTSAVGRGAAAPSTGGNPSPTRAGGMGSSMLTPAPSTSPAGSNMPMPANADPGTNARPPITAQTEGVIGIPDLKLTPAAPTASQGSVVSSEKNNVKIESGTLMLLRVNQ